ncbi:MAG: PA0069 family radical SAM protein [Myxococcales bacterium]|nr:PA0069 family radical SAM protein [Myxococcales bacterium]
MSDPRRPSAAAPYGPGRGATQAPAPRFLRVISAETPEGRFDDGWGADEAATTRQTVVTFEHTRSPLSTNDSPDLPFSASLNPYKGCEHGCIYCFARPTHAYLDLSPGIDFETRLVAKPELPQALRTLFRKPSWRPQVIALGANTDPYQPIEREQGLSREVLEVMQEFQNPVAIVTKNNLVVRDLDLLVPLAKAQLAHVFVSVTTLDRGLARKMEPRAATPEKRLEAIATLARAGVPVGVMASPMIPGLNDAELDRILEAARQAGARSAAYIMVRLPLELKALFEGWLDTHYPERKTKILNLIRQVRGGKLYDAQWGSRMRGEGVYADLLRHRFEAAERRLGFGVLPPLRTDLFRVPAASGDQLSLFGR